MDILSGQCSCMPLTVPTVQRCSPEKKAYHQPSKTPVLVHSISSVVLSPQPTVRLSSKPTRGTSVHLDEFKALFQSNYLLYNVLTYFVFHHKPIKPRSSKAQFVNFDHFTLNRAVDTISQQFAGTILPPTQLPKSLKDHVPTHNCHHQDKTTSCSPRLWAR